MADRPEPGDTAAIWTQEDLRPVRRPRLRPGPRGGSADQGPEDVTTALILLDEMNERLRALEERSSRDAAVGRKPPARARRAKATDSGSALDRLRRRGPA
jgi:hypothetical protein